MRNVHQLGAGVVALLLVALAQAPVGATVPNDAALIAAVRDQWSVSINARQLDDILPLYAEGAVLMPQYAAPQLGHDAIAAWYTEHFARIDASYDYHADSLRVMGSWAFESFTIELTVAPRADEGLAVSSDAVQTRASGTRVYRRGRSGWRIDREVWSGLRPAGAFATSVLLRSCRPQAC